jgi:peptide/nickel transport system substrate-binding protein
MLCGCLLFAVALSGCSSSSISCACIPRISPQIVDSLPAEPDSLLVGQSVEPVSALIMNTIWAPLIYTDSHGQPQPGLITELPTRSNGGYSADFKTITLHLRPDLKWSDGSPLTAQDVVYTINLLKNPDYGQKTGFAGSEIERVTTLDSHTIVLRLTTVDAAFLASSLTDALHFAPLPQRVYGGMSAGDIPRSSQASMPQVTSGPFNLNDWVQGDLLIPIAFSKRSSRSGSSSCG